MMQFICLLGKEAIMIPSISSILRIYSCTFSLSRLCCQVFHAVVLCKYPALILFPPFLCLSLSKMLPAARSTWTSYHKICSMFSQLWRQKSFAEAFRSSPEPDALDSLLATGGCNDCNVHPTLNLLDHSIGVSRSNCAICSPIIASAAIGGSSAILMHSWVIHHNSVRRCCRLHIHFFYVVLIPDAV